MEVFYPVNDFGPMMKGLVIGGLGIFHVFTAQFAIGGGLLLCYFQWLSMRHPSEAIAVFLRGYFGFLVLISFVAGAVTGVGMWLTSIQISPHTIGLMVDEFHWIWAIEWTFFCLEIVAGYVVYRYAQYLDGRSRLTLLGLYAVAAWGSLFWINGILSWQLTPGTWPDNGRVWAGFFNPSFWPSLIYRTIASLTIAALVAMAVVNGIPSLERRQRVQLVHQSARLLTPMAVMPLIGIWYVAVMPADSRGWVLGGSPAMSMFLAISVIASMMIGLYVFIALLRQKLYINGATATLLCAMALAATAGGEFVREGVRKPFTIRDTLFSNSLRVEDISRLRRVGGTTLDPYPLRHAERLPTEQLRTGALVFRQQCSICHTVHGVNSLVELTKTWHTDQKRINIAMLQWLKPFMPPFAGTPSELEGLVQFLEWHQQEQPGEWPDSLESEHAADTLSQIRQWLNEAGPDPATAGRWGARGRRPPAVRAFAPPDGEGAGAVVQRD